MELSIVVPIHNEAGSLPELAERLRAACEGFAFEVWMIDDGSIDDSWPIIQELCDEDPRFAGLQLGRNYGKSAALALGFERASGEYIATLDGDLQDDPAELPVLIDRLEEGYDLVSGWKKERQDPIGKTVPSRFFNFITRTISGIAIHDFNCGLKVYRREVAKSVRVYGELHRYIPLLAKWEGYNRIAEEPVQHRERKYGETKFGWERFVRGFLDLISVTFLTRFAARPMHFFGTLGTLSFVSGFLISLWLSVEKIFFGHALGDRPLLLFGVLLLLLGLQLFTTGLLGEMIIQPRMERTDSYQVSETIEPALGNGETEERERVRTR